MNRYVYHAPWEVPPRALASGDQNVVGMGAMAMIPSPAGDVSPILRARACPAWGCSGPSYDPVIRLPRYFGPPTYAGPGPTASVPQPPPTSGGTLLVPDPGVLPISPQPSPTVGAPTSLTLQQPGTTLTSSGSSTTVAPTGISAVLTDFENWLMQSTTLVGYSVPNWGIAVAAVVGAYMFMGKRGRR